MLVFTQLSVWYCQVYISAHTPLVLYCQVYKCLHTCWHGTQGTVIKVHTGSCFVLKILTSCSQDTHMFFYYTQVIHMLLYCSLDTHKLSNVLTKLTDAFLTVARCFTTKSVRTPFQGRNELWKSLAIDFSDGYGDCCSLCCSGNSHHYGLR